MSPQNLAHHTLVHLAVPPISFLPGITAMYKGYERQTTVEVRVDGALVTTWTSSGETDNLQSIAFTARSGSVIDVTGVLADTEWLSIIEVCF